MLIEDQTLPYPLIFIDLETSSGDFREGRVIEIGAIKVHRNGEEEYWDTLVNPRHNISPFVEQLTGLTDVALRKAPRFEEIVEPLLSFLDGGLFIAHNAKNDWRFLNKEMNFLGRTFETQALCSLKLSQALHPHEKKHGLEALAERYDLSRVCHRAYQDAEHLWLIWQKWQEEIESLQFTSTVQRCIQLLPAQNIQTKPKKQGIQRARVFSTRRKN